jgi:hypothetical protein
MSLTKFLDTFPIASAVFLVYAVVGGAAMLIGSLENGAYVDSLLKVGAGTGAIGAARAFARR